METSNHSYIVALTSNSNDGYRERLKATTLTSAKREAYKRFGDGFRGDKICISEIYPDNCAKNVAIRYVGTCNWINVTNSFYQVEL